MPESTGVQPPTEQSASPPSPTTGGGVCETGIVGFAKPPDEVPGSAVPVVRAAQRSSTAAQTADCSVLCRLDRFSGATKQTIRRFRWPAGVRVRLVGPRCWATTPAHLAPSDGENGHSSSATSGSWCSTGANCPPDDAEAPAGRRRRPVPFPVFCGGRRPVAIEESRSFTEVTRAGPAMSVAAPILSIQDRTETDAAAGVIPHETASATRSSSTIRSSSETPPTVMAALRRRFGHVTVGTVS